MEGTEVYSVLKRKYIHNLYHANTVTTSCTFLRLGGLASRGLVAELGLPQTPQPSDDVDRKFGIWYDVFADTVDIHERARRPNEYGPILFTFPAEILNNLPQGSEVLVTKDNPIYWHSNAPQEQFFTDVKELDSCLEKGTFAQMVVIRTPKEILPFPKRGISITVDEPQRNLLNGVSAYKHAINKIQPAALRQSIPVSKRVCGSTCRCTEEYKKFSTSDFERFFG